VSRVSAVERLGRHFEDDKDYSLSTVPQTPPVGQVQSPLVMLAKNMIFRF